jgi:hypothetical protein
MKSVKRGSNYNNVRLESMGFTGYVSVCVQFYCVGFHCLSLHVSAYMAIFRCVGYFIFICLKDSASLLRLEAQNIVEEEADSVKTR